MRFALLSLLIISAALLLIGGSEALLVLCALASAVWLSPRSARAEELEVRSALSGDAQAVLDASPDACIVLSREGTIIWANAAAREQFGPFATGNPFSLSMRVPELIRSVSKAGRSGLSERARWSQKVPTSRFFEAFISPFALAPSAGASKDAIAVFIHDLSEQQRLDRMREDFVANASHELRTPLAALTGFIETLQGPAKDDEKARAEFLAIMLGQAERMKRLTDALLSLSRIEMRAHVRPTEQVDFVASVRQAVELARAYARDYRVELVVDIAEEHLFLRGDADEIIQLIDNLLENAIKYGADGERVDVRVSRQVSGSVASAVAEVQDYGPGIPPEHVPRLTERFYRVDVEASRARQGTGLGLAIVKHIVARHRGRLTVRSEVGVGSTFMVKIPMDTGLQ
ncbi:MAG: ATP-binding protein [Pseudomonadota bacterium]